MLKSVGLFLLICERLHSQRRTPTGVYNVFLLFLAVFLFSKCVIDYLTQFVCGDSKRIADSLERPFYDSLISGTADQQSDACLLSAERRLH